MTGYKHINGKGSLFKNEKKEKETSPDYKGDCMIKDQQYWVSAWINGSVKGKYIKISFQEKEVNKAAGSKSSIPESFSEEIPFMRIK